MATTFLGQSRRSMECGGVRVCDSAYSSRLDLPRHSHPRAHLCLVLSGRYVETIRGDREHRGPMMLLYYPADCPHSESHLIPGRHFLMEWDAEWADQMGVKGLPDRPRIVEQQAPVFAALRSLRSLHDKRTLETEAGVLRVLSEIGRSPAAVHGRIPRWLPPVLERLRDSPTDPPSLARLAEIARVHPSHLARAFLRYTGCTVGKMRRQFQLEHACRRLVTSNETLCDVSIEAGFADQSHMTRALRQETGFTPRGLRAATAPEQSPEPRSAADSPVEVRPNPH